MSIDSNFPNVLTGDVWLDDFDRGVVETFGAVVNTVGDMYVIKDLTGVSPPPPTGGIEFEGVPVYFSFPDETIDPKILPSFVVRRDDITPAMSRWHLGASQYLLPAPGATTRQVFHPITGNLMAQGPDALETKSQAVPFDLLYTIQIRARYRNNLKVEAMKMLRYTMRQYQPYTTVFTRDSREEVRAYNAYMEGPSALDTKPDVSGREAGFNVSLRVEAELDLNDPIVVKTMSQLGLITVSEI